MGDIEDWLTVVMRVGTFVTLLGNIFQVSIEVKDLVLCKLTSQMNVIGDVVTF